MDQWIGIRPDSLPKVILRPMAWITTFSPVARLNSIRILFSIAVNLSWPLFQLDIKNPFLYGDLKKVYMEQSLMYVAQGKNKACRLRKAIYRLKQSPRTCL